MQIAELKMTPRPVTRILCGGGANKAKVDQTFEMYFLLSVPFI